MGLWGLAQKTRGASALAPAALIAGLLETWSAVGVGARTETEPRAGGARIAGWGLEAAAAALLLLPPLLAGAAATAAATAAIVAAAAGQNRSSRSSRWATPAWTAGGGRSMAGK